MTGSKPKHNVFFSFLCSNNRFVSELVFHLNHKITCSQTEPLLNFYADQKLEIYPLMKMEISYFLLSIGNEGKIRSAENGEGTS